MGSLTRPLHVLGGYKQFQFPSSHHKNSSLLHCTVPTQSTLSNQPTTTNTTLKHHPHQVHSNSVRPPSTLNFTNSYCSFKGKVYYAVALSFRICWIFSSLRALAALAEEILAVTSKICKSTSKLFFIVQSISSYQYCQQSHRATELQTTGTLPWIHTRSGMVKETAIIKKEVLQCDVPDR